MDPWRSSNVNWTDRAEAYTLSERTYGESEIAEVDNDIYPPARSTFVCFIDIKSSVQGRAIVTYRRANHNLGGQRDVALRRLAVRTWARVTKFHLCTYPSLEISRVRSDLTALQEAIVLKFTKVSQSLQSDAGRNKWDTLQWWLVPHPCQLCRTHTNESHWLTDIRKNDH